MNVLFIFSFVLSQAEAAPDSAVAPATPASAETTSAAQMSSSPTTGSDQPTGELASGDTTSAEFDAALDAAFNEGVLGVLEEEKQLFKTASKTATTLDETPAILTVLTRDEIRRMGLRTLAEAMPLVPGVAVSLSNDGQRRFNFRGRNSISSEGVKILIDGHSLNEPSTSGATRVFDTYPLQHVERIEVIRGPGSALYGANAFTGVINLVTRKTGHQVYELSGQADSLLTFGVGGYGTQDIGPVQVTAFLGLLTTQGSRRTIDQDRLSGTTEAAQGVTPFRADTRERRLDTMVRVDHKYFELAGGYSGKMRGDFAGVDFVVTGGDQAVPPAWLTYGHGFADALFKPGTFFERFTPTLRFFFDFSSANEDVRLTAAPYRINRDLDSDGDDELWAEGRRRRRTSNTMNIGGELSSSITLFEGNTLSVGYVHELQRQLDATQRANFDLDSGAVTPFQLQSVHTEPKYDREIVAGYIEDYWKLFGIAAVTGGLRIDHYRDFGFAFSPRAAVVVQPLEGFFIKALYGRAFRAPSFSELFSRRDQSVIGNPTLRPEVLNTVEGQLSFRRRNPFKDTRPKAIVDKLLAQGTYYWTQIDDAIVVGTQIGGTGPRRLENLGSVVLHGAEIDLRLSFIERVGFYTNANFRSARNGRTGERLPEVSDILLNVGGNFAILSWLTVDSGIILESERSRFAGDNPLRANGLRTNADRLARIPTIVDWRAAITVHDLPLGPVQFDVALVGRNLLNQRQYDPSPLYSGPGTATTPTDYPRPGLYVGGLLTVRFAKESTVQDRTTGDAQ